MAGEPVLEHKYADVNGVRLHYVTAGTGDVVLFLHGFPEFWYAWRHQLADLGKDHRAVALDMRGYNLSAKPGAVDEYRIDRLVSDIKELGDHLGAEKLTLVGHDWGGVVAWHFAARHPERLSRLVIINSPHPVLFRRQVKSNPAQMIASSYVLAFLVPGAEKVLAAGNYAFFRRGFLERLVRKGYLPESGREAYLKAWSQPDALRSGLNYYRAAMRDTKVRMPRVAVPTLVVWGEKDPYLKPELLDGLEDMVPGVRVERVGDASHWIVHERPDLVSRLIRGSLTGP